MNDPYDLQRFVDAQGGVYGQVCKELRRGRKSSHWMWFIFPQMRGLGYSQMAARFGIGSREEAEAYLRHPVLGARLRECTALVNAIGVNAIGGRTVGEIFGYPDDLKFRSSMTLFAKVAKDGEVFEEALKKYFAGEPDARTIELLKQS